MMAVFAAGMAAFAADPGFAGRARAHAATYAWEATARGYARVYESIVGPRVAANGILAAAADS